MSNKTRLDVLLVERGLAQPRQRAQARDVVVILAAVELRDIDDAVV